MPCCSGRLLTAPVGRPRLRSNALKLGLDYYVSKKSTLGVVLNGMLNPSWNKTFNTSKLTNGQGELDSIITAVGMVDNLGVMMAAVVIAMAVMLLASKPLTRFVNQHPTVVVLCLSFLLMIGLSRVAEGFGFHIPKGYLYAAIGFSITIEFFNQVARRNFIRHQSTLPLRARTADAILRMMGGRCMRI